MMTALMVLIGLIIGSFMNVVIYRGPMIWGLVAPTSDHKKFNLAVPRSHCPSCNKKLSAKQLIPVLSYLLQRGKCTHCQKKISLQYPIIEILGAIAALAAFKLTDFYIGTFFLFLFLTFIICLAAIDIQTKFLPDALTIPLIAIGLLVNTQGMFTPFLDAFIGSIVGFSIFWIIGEVFYRLRGVDGLGQGDAKLLAAIGAWFGWYALPFIVLVAAIAGLITLLILSKKTTIVTLETSIPFGPFLATGTVIFVVASRSGSLDFLF